MFCGTFTYPVAVRVARRVFKLRGFYAIHISIAPFLALVHINIFGTLHGFMRAKIAEQEYKRLAPLLKMQQSSLARKNDPSFPALNALIR